MAARPLVSTPVALDRRPGCDGDCKGGEWKLPAFGVPVQLPYGVGQQMPYTVYFCADCASTLHRAKQAARCLRKKLISQFAKEAYAAQRPFRAPKAPVVELRRVRVLGGSLTLEIADA